MRAIKKSEIADRATHKHMKRNWNFCMLSHSPGQASKGQAILQ